MTPSPSDPPSRRADTRAPAKLQQLPSWLLSQASAHGTRLVAEALATEGLRRSHYRVMSALEELESASQIELGAHVWLDRSDLHGVVVELERRELVVRERDPIDRRRNVVTLSAGGRTTLARLDALVATAQAQLVEPLSAPEREQLIALLGKLVETPD